MARLLNTHRSSDIVKQNEGHLRSKMNKQLEDKRFKSLLETIANNVHAFSLAQLVQILQVAVKIKVPDDRLVNQLLDEIANRLSGQHRNIHQLNKALPASDEAKSL